jgi:hypothetical protein
MLTKGMPRYRKFYALACSCLKHAGWCLRHQHYHQVERWGNKAMSLLAQSDILRRQS